MALCADHGDRRDPGGIPGRGHRPQAWTHRRAADRDRHWLRYGGLTFYQKIGHFRRLTAYIRDMTRLRFALRSLLRAPMLSLIVILSVGLGVGANTAIFSLMHQILLN